MVAYYNRDALPVKKWGVPVKYCPTLDKEIIMNALAMTESSLTDNPEIIGYDGKSKGIWQITDPVISDYAKSEGYMPDWRDPVDNYLVAQDLLFEKIPVRLKNLGLEDTLKNRVFAYNGGAGNVKKPNQTMIEHNERFFRNLDSIKGAYVTETDVPYIEGDELEHQKVEEGGDVKKGISAGVAVVLVLGIGYILKKKFFK